ncbi:hypothetical protein A1O1_01754 [Capronia coronata CBS 617.96]|uniref:Uncharacterized protein n=1 Tax=Capronia coronata CBS 617.96 TaxID=1182541 RepID=W9YKG5_9EURO|nr:uncharacterized protein A1O1_01754 [Capronia coronata CBS 617.96]EXJ93362.1 hypothetical protein A1O1_01754 [Capronia coronata CBS 617.96]
MPSRLWTFLSIHQEMIRGRSARPQCGANRKPQREEKQKDGPREQVFKPEWFAGNPDIEDEEDNGDKTRNTCLCEGETDVRTTGINLYQPVEGRRAYPSYLRIYGPGRMLVKGSTCRYIMELHEQGLQPSRIASKILDMSYAEVYTAAEIRAVIHSCTTLDLNGHSPLATESWEQEPIEGWWFKEESYCEALRRQLPVDKDVCGYDCDEGWWKDRQHEDNRDWVRFGERSIGSHSQRRN